MSVHEHERTSTKGNAMSTKHYENRQARYTDRYTIEFRPEGDGTISLWCHQAPRNAFDDSVSKCHLYSNGKICVRAGKEPRSQEVAEAVAHYWMAGYSEYVRTGQFPDRGGRVRV
jgi:hypothetical protein